MGTRLWLAVASISALICISFFVFKQSDKLAKPEYLESKREVVKLLRVAYEIINDRDIQSDNVVFWAELPGNGFDRQNIITEPLRKDSFESSMVNDGRLELGVGSLPPFGKRRVDIVITAKVSDSALQGTKLTADERQSYLLPELYVNSDSDQIIHLANSLRGDSEFESSRLVYEWVSQNVQALKYNIKPKAALNVIQERQGDCTDMMFLVVSLLRAQGIPARMLAGYIADRDSLKLDSSMYHNWAEFYDGSRWVISDPQRKKFDQGYSEYLVVKEVTSETVVGARFGIVGSDGINVNIL